MHLPVQHVSQKKKLGAAEADRTRRQTTDKVHHGHLRLLLPRITSGKYKAAPGGLGPLRLVMAGGGATVALKKNYDAQIMRMTFGMTEVACKET